MRKFDVTIIGAGAAGMMCAIQAARRGRTVLLVDHASSAGDKIRISGGGKCNFTNLDIRYDKFISKNPRFMASCLSRYTQWDFIDWIVSCGIMYHEKTLGQLFCDNSSKDILEMLNKAMSDAGVVLELNTSVNNIKRSLSFEIELSTSFVTCESLVIASGGKSIPKMGATGFGYKTAEQFGLSLVETRPGLVPLTFAQQELPPIKKMSGTSVEASVCSNNVSFDEGLLFTHRGLSGPSILQISSYWREGDEISVNLLRNTDVLSSLKIKRQKNGKQAIHNALNGMLPSAVAQFATEMANVNGNIGDQSDVSLKKLSDAVNEWRIKPVGSEGYRTAEVTLGGVNTDELNSRTMECKSVKGLYFIGEVVDVTGWLGGYNFQWAWSSGWAAGQEV
jgi:predicted Rossmann fold flavoprotein